MKTRHSGCGIALVAKERTGPSCDPSRHPTANTFGSGDLESCLIDLCKSRDLFAGTTIRRRIELAEACIEGVVATAHEWVDAACYAKGIDVAAAARTEEILGGPVIAVRHLRLLVQCLRGIETHGVPSLPGKFLAGPDGRLQVQVFPTNGLFDSSIFIGFKAFAWMQTGVRRENLHDSLAKSYRGNAVRDIGVSLVLGAGNVSGIPITDAITKLFQENNVVLLKMHPVNRYLGPIFKKAFRPLIDAGFLRIIDGGADVGAAAIQHPLVDNVHITGSVEAHEAIVWGAVGEQRAQRRQQNRPLLTKPLTSELGNVSPWIIAPGRYSDRQLRFQAENVAASLTNNAAFNCVSTRVLITSKRWPDRERFLDLLQETLATIPRRTAYYPGALERYRRFAGDRLDDAETDRLPWTLLRDIPADEATHRLREECFVCVCSEVALDVAEDEDFLDRAVDFANQELGGTLCVAVTVPNSLRRTGLGEQRFQSSIGRLRYGSVCINHWPGVAYAMISPPWGGYPGGSLADVQSGIGWVHNSYMLDNVEKSVLEGPLTVFPKPIWLPTHARPEPIAWRLLELYHKPSWWNFTNLSCRALRSGFSKRGRKAAEVQGS